MKSAFSKLQNFIVNDSERVNGGVCFQLQAVTAVISREGFFDRVCNGMSLLLQDMTDLYLEKVRPFTTKNYFVGKLPHETMPYSH